MTKPSINLLFSAALFILLIPACEPDFETVTIGDQVWMKENLNIKTGISWCYDNAPANCEIYGRLYTWRTALKVCPPGWHLPTTEEWQQLADYLGGSDVAGGKMKSTGRWRSPNTDATNESGFTALPGGIRSSPGGFYGLGNYGYWWSSTEAGIPTALFHSLSYNNGILVENIYTGKRSGLSVRCIKK